MIKPIRIVTDSTCDIPPEIAEKLCIHIVPCYINFGTSSFLDRVELSREDFYQRLASDSTHPHTAAPPPGIFAELYRSLLDDASAIISLHPPDNISALRQSAITGWSTIKSNIPFRAIDTGQLSMSLGWMAIKAAQAAADGAPIDTIESLIIDLRERTHLFAALDTVAYLRQSGRVSWASGTIGRLLQIRPMLQVHQGEIRSIGYSRTMRHAMRRLVHELHDLEPIEELTILHTDAPEIANNLLQQIESALPPEKILTTNVTPILGTHVGPKAVGFVAIQK